MAAKKTCGLPSNVRIEEILSYYVDTNGICKICGLDHSYKRNFADVASSIDIIAELFKRRKLLEQCQIYEIPK